MQTTAMDVVATIEVKIWARNEKEKDTLSTDVYNELRIIQFDNTTGSVDNNLHNFNLLSMNEEDEIGEQGIKSRILQISYNFWNVN